MTKGLRVGLLALLAALLFLGAPTTATFAAPGQPGGGPAAEEDDRRGARSAQPDDKGEEATPGSQDGGQDPKAGSPKDPKAGDPKAGDPKAGDPKAGDGKGPRVGDQAGEDKQEPQPGDEAAGKGPKGGGKKDSDGRDRDDDDYSRHYDGPHGRYDHGRHGYHGRHGWDTHRRYYRHGYHGPGWYDDCGYYGPDGHDGWYYNSPDACDWQYGPEGDSLRSNLAGDQVVPGPGAPDAFGTANLFVDLGRGVLCYRMGYDGISRPNGAHVHRGGPGQAGQPVIDLHPEMHGDEGCVGADPTVLRNLRDHPEAFYLNLHTPEYPDGAIRGQVFRTRHYG